MEFKIQWSSFSKSLNQSLGEWYDIDPQYKDFVVSYLESEKQTVASLEQALENKNYSKISYVADMIYGHGGSLGFPMISHIGKAIELAADSQNYLLTSNLLSDLKTYLEFLSSSN